MTRTNLPNPHYNQQLGPIRLLHGERGFFLPTASASSTERSSAHHVRRQTTIPARTASPCPIRPLKRVTGAHCRHSRAGRRLQNPHVRHSCAGRNHEPLNYAAAPNLVVPPSSHRATSPLPEVIGKVRLSQTSPCAGMTEGERERRLQNPHVRHSCAGRNHEPLNYAAAPNLVVPPSSHRATSPLPEVIGKVRLSQTSPCAGMTEGERERRQ
jgi:hypothetical protein